MPETPAQPIQAPAPRHHGHTHGEAFCLMHYRSEDGTADEWIWNSRDGVTPFMVHTRDGKVMQHVEWRRDRYFPSYVPPVGSRVFVDLTPERARHFAKQKVELYWDDAHTPMRESFPEGTTREQAVTILADQMMREHGGSNPDLIEVTPKMHLAFQKRADAFLLHRTPYVGHN